MTQLNLATRRTLSDAAARYVQNARNMAETRERMELVSRLQRFASLKMEF